MTAEPPDPIPGGAIVYEDRRLGDALREAVAQGATRIRLFTDGCIPFLPPEPPPVPVDVVLLDRRDNVAVLEVRAPARIPVATDFAVEVVVGRTRGPARPAVAVVVTLLRDGERVGSPMAVRLERGGTARVLVRDRVDREGVVRYAARIEDPVGAAADDDLGTAARIGERPVVVSIGGPLEVPGMDVLVAGHAPALDVADAIVVHRVPPDGSAIVRAVRGGAGLVLLGGSGVAGREIESVLPLTDRPPEGRAIVLLLDVSGSMEPLLRELGEATGKLLSHFAPDDQVAFVTFRHHVLAASPWRRAAGARPDLSAGAGGSTLLLPALAEAERLLAAAKGERRLFVISDGKWNDRTSPDLARKVAALGGMHRAALFVEEDVPEEAKALFPVSLTAKEDLADALRKLEDAAADRTVPSADATVSPAPLWLEGAAPPAGTYRDFPRLYPRGVGETVVLSAGGIPIVAAWRPGGKVVMSATAEVDLASLVRAVLKDTGGVRLRAWRAGDDVVAEATGSGGAPFVFGEASVAARPVARDRWRATLPNARTHVEVACAGAFAHVPYEGRPGLGNRPDVAARIAASSGGRVLDRSAPFESGAGGTAAWATLLAAAALVVVSAWRRGRA